MGHVGAHNKPPPNVLLLHGGYFELRASLVAKTVKNLPPMQETQVRSLGQEDPLEKEKMQPTPVFLLGKSHGQRSLVGYNPWGRKEPDMTDRSHIQKRIRF